MTNPTKHFDEVASAADPVSAAYGAHEYAFDIKLLAAIRVRANCEEEARAKLRAALDCADTNFGQTTDGQLLCAEASIDGDLDLYEIDGDPCDSRIDGAPVARCAARSGPYKATMLRVGLRVGAVSGPGDFPANRPGRVTEKQVTRWGTSWRVQMDDGSEEWISGTETKEAGIGWYAIDVAG